MPSLINTLKKVFRRKQSRSQKSSNSRLATFESLEQRNLLNGDVPASLIGTIYIDHTDNGVTTDDAEVSGALVELYRDGGNNFFDGGQNDDTLVATDTSNSNGQYRFDNLTPGSYFVRQTPAAGLLQRDGGKVQQVIVTDADMEGIERTPIDTFQTAQMVEASYYGSRFAASSMSASEALGGERDLVAELTSDFGKIQLSANGFGDPVLQFDSSATATGRRVVTWDGADGVGDETDYRGLGGHDLTEGDTVRGIQFTFGADHSVGTLTLRVYTDQDNWSQAVLDIPQTGGRGSSPLVLPLDQFVAVAGDGADLTNVGAIELEIDGDAAIDGQINRIETYGPRIFEANFTNLEPLSLGNIVWFDGNNNATYSPSEEQGIADVLLNLYADADGNGEFSATIDTPLTNQRTDASGNYLFDSLLPGNYLVQVDASNFAAGGALEGLVLTTGAIATDPDDNVNNDNNGLLTASGAIATAAVTLTTAAEPVDDGDTSASSNLTVDIGFTLFDLSITKSDAPDPAVAGESLTYTLQITNHGPADATDVTVVDNLPTGLSNPVVTTSQGNGSSGGQTVTALLGSLLVGETATVTIIADIDPDVVGQLTNTAVVSGRCVTAEPVPNDPWTEVDLTNNEDQAVTTVNALIDLSIDKSDQPDPVVPGEQLTYTVLVTNNGPSVATGVTVTDMLPAGVRFTSATSSQGTTAHDNGSVSADLGRLDPGDSATITIVSDVDAGQTSPLLNVATVTGNEEESNLDNNRDEEPTAVVPRIDLTIDKSDNPDPVVPGEQLTYTVVVTNNGPSVATGVTASDRLPAGVSFASVTSSQGTALHDSGEVSAILGTLDPGASATITIVTDVSAAQTLPLLNVVSVKANEEESNLDNNRDEEPTAVVPQVDLEIDKSDDPDAVVAGEQLTYRLIVTNNGPSVATGTTVNDALPDGVSFVSATSSQGDVQHTAGTVTADLGDLNPGASATITIVTAVDPAQTETLLNTATVTSNEEDTDPTNNDDEEPTAVEPRVDLVVTKIDNPDPVIAGHELTYTIEVRNDGPSTATGVIVTDQLPAAVQFVSGSSTQGTLSETNGVVTVSVGTLEPGASASVVLSTSVDSGAPNMLLNTVTTTSDQPDDNPDDNTDDEPTKVVGRFDLQVEKTDSVDPVMAGEELTYTIVVTNNGPSDTNNVVMTDALPDEVNFISASTTQGTVTESGGVVVAQLGYLEDGQSEIVTILVQVGFDVVGEIDNEALVAGSPVQSDPTSPSTFLAELNLDNNLADEPTLVQAAFASVSGYIYVDFDNDGQMETGDWGIEGVEVRLTGVDVLGNTVTQFDTTDEDGAYGFYDLLPGSYSVTETQPDRFRDGRQLRDGRETPGRIGSGTGLLQFSVHDDLFANIGLNGGVDAIEFNFGELMHTISKRDLLSSSPSGSTP